MTAELDRNPATREYVKKLAQQESRCSPPLLQEDDDATL
jgi:hypothetical protein